jgi:hypothetical protein
MLTIKTDVRMVESSDDDSMYTKPKPVAKLAGRPRPKPVTKTSQRQAKVPNVADQRDLVTDKGPSKKKSDRIRKFFFFFYRGFT